MKRILSHFKAVIIAALFVALICITGVTILAFWPNQGPQVTYLRTYEIEVDNLGPDAIDWSGYDILGLARKRRPNADDGELVYIAEQIVRKAAKYGLRPSFVAALVDTESNFDPRAVSRCGAKGLMQIMPYHYGWMGITDPFDVEQNLEGGCLFLSRLVRKCGEVGALKHYNGGYRPDNPETRAYVPAVLSRERSLARSRRQTAWPVESAKVYVVQPGDTLWKIASRFGTTVERLARENAIENADLIRTGRRLKV